jgi:GNAT superfamily N-acetyltransferase
MAATTPMIRLYQPEDRAALYDICIRTGELGGDARGIYQDHELLPDIFAAPYAFLEPDLAFVLDDGGEAVGYVVGTRDTQRFVKAFREEWLPRVAERHPPVAGAPRTPDEVMRMLLHWPERMIVPELAEYPAHLHIDLLPDYQGRGYGRALLTRLFAALRDAGVARLHLGMVTENVKARAFYDRTGFHVIPVADAGVLTYLGRATD